MTEPQEPLAIVAPDTFDILVVCGGTGWGENEFPTVTETARTFLDAGNTVAAICGATFGFARAGLLNDRPHTSNSLDFLKKAPGYTGEKHYRDVVGAVVDDDLITAPGHAPAHFTAEIFRAAGVRDAKIEEFLGMLGAEHKAAA
jgi:putative intracellular protease/amidase